jgi:hypothetical protein
MYVDETWLANKLGERVIYPQNRSEIKLGFPLESHMDFSAIKQVNLCRYRSPYL